MYIVLTFSVVEDLQNPMTPISEKSSTAPKDARIREGSPSNLKKNEEKTKANGDKSDRKSEGKACSILQAKLTTLAVQIGYAGCLK